MKSILCFYHSPCNDGASAAAALQVRMERAGLLDDDREIRFCPMNYTTGWEEPLADGYVENEILPEHPVETIYIVDITFSKVKFEQIIRHLRKIGKVDGELPRVVCIDHHESAVQRSEELREFCDETYIRQGSGLSGATLVWKYFNEKLNDDIEIPEMLRYVADQDIWEWKLPDSREINAALNILEGRADIFLEELRGSIEDTEAWKQERKLRGAAIISMVESEVKKTAWHSVEIEIPPVKLYVLNSASFSSELGNYLCSESKSAPNVIAVIYSIQQDWNVRCSIRSIPGGAVTARRFAERFGGGGHDHAAGCRFGSFSELRESLRRLQEEGWG